MPFFVIASVLDRDYNNDTGAKGFHSLTDT